MDSLRRAEVEDAARLEEELTFLGEEDRESGEVDDLTVRLDLGVATAINFQPTGDGKAAITGDFGLTAEEVNPVLRTLEEQGIAVTALHSHMLTEAPRLFFMHFWANDDAMRLARGLRLALEHTRAKPSTP